MNDFLGLPPDVMEMLPLLLLATVAAFFIIIFIKIYAPFAARQVQNRQGVAGISMQDIERMRREGLISEDEFKQVRRKAAQRELEAGQKRQQIDLDRQILAEVEINPEAARKLLAPQQLTEAQPRDEAIPPTQPAAGPSSEPAKHPRPGRLRVPPPPDLPAPAEEVDEIPDKSAGKRDLDLLFEKGAISRAEYERLSKFIR